MNKWQEKFWKQHERKMEWNVVKSQKREIEKVLMIIKKERSEKWKEWKEIK